MELTDTGLIVLLAGLALLVFGLVVAGLPRWGNRAGRAVVRGTEVLVLNVLVVALCGAALNDQYLFYSSWGDLLGSRSTSVQVHHGGSAPDVVTARVSGSGLARVTVPTSLPRCPSGGRGYRPTPSSTAARTPRDRSTSTCRRATTRSRPAPTR